MIELVTNCFCKSQALYHYKILPRRNLPQKQYQLLKLLSIEGEEEGEHLEQLAVGVCCVHLSPLSYL